MIQCNLPALHACLIYQGRWAVDLSDFRRQKSQGALIKLNDQKKCLEASSSPMKYDTSPFKIGQTFANSLS